MEKSRQPSSPGISPVSISDSIEELLKFLLSASANETLEIDLGLSNAYCSYLLTPEPDHGSYHDAVDALQTSGGVPLYPLYKHLASTLHSCITSGAFWRTSNTITSIQEDECLKQKENEWSKLIASEGTELVKMLKVVDFELHVQEPFFTQLRVGLKTIEGRCAVGDYNRIGPGAFLLINKCLLLEVQNVKWYASFSEMMEAASLTRVLPGVETIEEGSTLTDGARALAKHVNRSSDGWWGNFGGNDSDKNRLALNLISRLITHCCWMNTYVIQPHDCVFEIRVVEGYGARWSKDGSKFIGFLEPYTKDGHLKGWKH
ncbi:uncharacterized protein LOC131240181 isoform X9 [Magnolia sinica]|uniref:uncharacterized protein LOC131240181 isoform X9 n=1 Tax=Magnolia sinica TaxID=86752 RepID=UPI0026590ED4|nr:uncharacterized protein LOC131240181 isoform X9 [Magnolia sinica]